MPETIFTVTNQRLAPCMNPSDARTSNGKYGASKVFQAGAAIGRKTTDGLLYPCVSANGVQTITPNSSASAGTFTITLLNCSGQTMTTTPLAYTAIASTIQTALDVASGVANGVVATTTNATAGVFSTASNVLTLTFSGSGYAALEQPLVSVDTSLLTFAGTTGATVARVQPNHVETITLNAVLTTGSVELSIPRPDGTIVDTGTIAFNATLANLQTALDTATGITNGIVAATGGSAAPFSSAGTVTLTFSGTGGYSAWTPPALVSIWTNSSSGGDTQIIVADTTVTKDGTEVCVGFVEYGFRTDANSKCFLNSVTAASDVMAPGYMTMPYFVKGTFATIDIPGWRDRMLNDLNARYVASGIVMVP